MNPEILAADPTRDRTVGVPHLQPHRERRIRSSRVRIHHVRVLVHDTSIEHCRDNGMSVFITPIVGLLRQAGVRSTAGQEGRQ